MRLELPAPFTYRKLKSAVKCLPGVGPALVTLYRGLLRLRFDPSLYWERRYRLGGTSGPGSQGKLAEFKAEVLNGIVRERGVRSIVEFGCGDGNQLSLANYPEYTGMDISACAIAACQKRFQNDQTKVFVIYDPDSYIPFNKAEATLSIDVIFHLTDDRVFSKYMTHLFATATRFVIIYSDDKDASGGDSIHIRHRQFSKWVGYHCPEWDLLEHIPNRYPPRRVEVGDGSWSDFWIYGKREM